MTNEWELCVFTCDAEGRFESFRDGGQPLFGYREEEMTGRKGFSMISPGPVILEYLPRWMEISRLDGEFYGSTVCLRKDGRPFAAYLRIWPRYRGGQLIGYKGSVEELVGIAPEEVMPKVRLTTKLLNWGSNFANVITEHQPDAPAAGKS